MQVVRAPAKLTLSLRITGVRSDGYHELVAEMVTLGIHDELWIEPDGSGCWLDHGDGPVEAGPDDLVVRALRAAGRTAGVTVHKRIPEGAGLGGGSADAAAVLRWAGVQDVDTASGLGADVPFCLIGGRARVSGIGEIVEPLDHREMTVTLLTPPLHCSTPEVYAAWDRLGGPVGAHGNDLEPAALEVAPELARYRDELGEVAGVHPRLAGSGSTWWVMGSFPGGGRVVTAAVPAPGPLPRSA